MANLQATLVQDLHRIWDGLSKPQELTGARLEDYFDMAFEALPHKVAITLRSLASTDIRLLRFLHPISLNHPWRR